jgi:hypothetical protein
VIFTLSIQGTGNLIVTAGGWDNGGGAAVLKLQSFDAAMHLHQQNVLLWSESGLGEFRNGVGLIFS